MSKTGLRVPRKSAEERERERQKKKKKRKKKSAKKRERERKTDRRVDPSSDGAKVLY